MNDQSGGEWNKGDRVWLLPDVDKREVKTKLPGVIEKTLPTGRVRVVYIEHRCTLVKTVEGKRVEHRDIPCIDLKEKPLDIQKREA